MLDQEMFFIDEQIDDIGIRKEPGRDKDAKNN